MLLSMGLGAQGEPTAEDQVDRKIISWMERHHFNATVVAAAGVLRSHGSLAKVASALWYAGYSVPDIALTEDELDDYARHEEEALQLFVEKYRPHIEKATASVGLYLLVTGRTLEKFSEDDEEG